MYRIRTLYGVKANKCSSLKFGVNDPWQILQKKTLRGVFTGVLTLVF